VSAKRDDWDDLERDTLAPIRDDIDRARERHRGDPPVEWLRAARDGAFGEDAERATAAHLASDGWSRALVDGAEPAPLDAAGEARVLAEIRRRQSRTGRRWLWPAAGLAAAAVVVVTMLPKGSVTTTPGPIDAPPAAPRFVLALEKPEVRLSADALLTRGPAGTGLLDDLAPAVGAYRANDYRGAAAALTRLQAAYPRAPEVSFYLGISRLFLDDPRGAADALRAVRAAAGDEFRAEADWYLAIAYERAGDRVQAHSVLQSLCRGESPFAARACAAEPALR
jgi:hypothetical protein